MYASFAVPVLCIPVNKGLGSRHHSFGSLGLERGTNIYSTSGFIVQEIEQSLKNRLSKRELVIVL